jgi:hypothetical protein
MLQAILSEIKNARQPLDLQSLSRRLEIEPQALEGMIQFLVQKGRLQIEPTYGNETEQCAGCVLFRKNACPGPEQCPYVFKLPPVYKVVTPHEGKTDSDEKHEGTETPLRAAATASDVERGHDV